MPTKKRQSALQVAYSGLVKAKSSYCQGKVTKTAVKSKAAKYVAAAVAKGQTKAEAQKKATRVLTGGCKISTSVAGRKRKTKTTTVGASRRRTTRRKKVA